MRRATQPELPRQLERGVRAAQFNERGVAKIVGGGGWVGIACARKDEEIGRRGDQQLERYLAIAGQGVIAREIAEAGGGEGGIGETAGGRDNAGHLVDEGAGRGWLARAAEGGQAAIERLEH